MEDANVLYTHTHTHTHTHTELYFTAYTIQAFIPSFKYDLSLVHTRKANFYLIFLLVVPLEVAPVTSALPHHTQLHLRSWLTSMLITTENC